MNRAGVTIETIVFVWIHVLHGFFMELCPTIFANLFQRSIMVTGSYYSVCAA